MMTLDDDLYDLLKDHLQCHPQERQECLQPSATHRNETTSHRDRKPCESFDDCSYGHGATRPRLTLEELLANVAESRTDLHGHLPSPKIGRGQHVACHLHGESARAARHEVIDVTIQSLPPQHPKTSRETTAPQMSPAEREITRDLA